MSDLFESIKTGLTQRVFESFMEGEYLIGRNDLVWFFQESEEKQATHRQYWVAFKEMPKDIKPQKVEEKINVVKGDIGYAISFASSDDPEYCDGISIKFKKTSIKDEVLNFGSISAKSKRKGKFQEFNITVYPNKQYLEDMLIQDEGGELASLKDEKQIRYPGMDKLISIKDLKRYL